MENSRQYLRRWCVAHVALCVGSLLTCVRAVPWLGGPQVRYENTSDMLDDSSAARPRMDAVKAALHSALAAPRTYVRVHQRFERRCDTL